MHVNPKSYSEKGFTVVETLLILIIATLIGFVSWYVWNQKKDADKALNAASQASQNTSPKIYSSNKSVKSVSFSQLPTDLKQAVLSNAPCAKNGELLNEVGSADTSTHRYVDKSSAFIGQCQTVALYAFTGGGWKYVGRTQYGFDCSTLKKYSVPAALANLSLPEGCLDASGNFVRY